MQTRHDITSKDARPRVLILGGTGEGAQLAARLAERTDLTVISSLAGRVGEPKLPQGLVRVGGFGGLDALASYLVKEEIKAVIDATERLTRTALSKPSSNPTPKNTPTIK